jgi:hypothetical protein
LSAQGLYTQRNVIQDGHGNLLHKLSLFEEGYKTVLAAEVFSCELFGGPPVLKNDPCFVVRLKRPLAIAAFLGFGFHARLLPSPVLYTFLWQPLYKKDIYALTSRKHGETHDNTTANDFPDRPSPKSWDSEWNTIRAKHIGKDIVAGLLISWWRA